MAKLFMQSLRVATVRGIVVARHSSTHSKFCQLCAITRPESNMLKFYLLFFPEFPKTFSYCSFFYSCIQPIIP